MPPSCPLLWEPHTGDLPDREDIEATAHYVLNHHGNWFILIELLKEFGLTTFEDFCISQQLTMLCMIRNGLVLIDVNKYMTPITWPSRRSNTQAYQVLQSNLNTYQYSFFLHTISDWNGLYSFFPHTKW